MTDTPLGDTPPLVIDGAHGEGGGQIVRTALTLSTITGRAVRLINIRANRRVPGLAAQHVTAVRAVAAVCGARVGGDAIGSTTLDFAPGHAPRPGAYAFDVSAAREGGSAGSTSLVLQAVLLPLALADGPSHVRIQGGTHVAWSPPFDYLDRVWLAILRRMGLDASMTLDRSGWYPAGGGAITAAVAGRARLSPLSLVERGALRAVRGRALAANLPAHIAQRMADRAHALLSALLDVPVAVEPQRLRATCPGAGLFLSAEYENVVAGFNALGRPGLPAEEVAENAAAALLAHDRTTAALDEHQADQILLPMALADGPSRYSTPRLTRHLQTNAWVIERFAQARAAFLEEEGRVLVTVTPLQGHAAA